MGYILHLMDAPGVKTHEDADGFISEQRRLPPSENAKFRAFVRDITAIYPDLSEEDEDGDDNENLWEEGIDDRASYGDVKELVVKADLTDEAVVTALVSAAVANGLTLYDAEGQVVYAE